MDNRAIGYHYQSIVDADGLLGEEVIVTQEFYISVTPVRDGEYLVRTERVAMGVPLAEELVRWEVDRWLGQAAQVMHDPIVGICVAIAAVRRPPHRQRKAMTWSPWGRNCMRQFFRARSATVG